MERQKDISCMDPHFLIVDSSILLRMWGVCSIYNEPVHRMVVPVCP